MSHSEEKASSKSATGVVETVITRLRGWTRQDRSGSKALIPIKSVASFHGQIRRAVGLLASEAPDEYVIIADPVTIASVDLLQPLLPMAAHVAVLGMPQGVSHPPNHVFTLQEFMGVPEDRLLIILSSGCRLGFFGSAASADDASTTGFDGGWTGSVDFVEHASRSILAEAAMPIPDWLPMGPAGLAVWSTRLCQLMAFYAQNTQSVSRQPLSDEIVGKDDLFSVLEILKAISAHRRSQEVLYVFVEEIARIIQVDRCSVVRVVSGETQAHVLASHDDASLHDLGIDLLKYPEILHSMETFAKVVIADAATEPVTRPYADQLRQARVKSILVIPIVLLDPNVGSLFLRATRSDKPFAAREVGFCEIVAEAASNALERAYLFESIQLANERLEHLAITDGLTGLYNHRYFRERLEQEFERARRYRLPLSCIIFDIDDFKGINDTYGHLAGDEILREMSERILKVTRKSDIVARYGGEEFTVIMPQTGYQGAMAEAERLRRELSNSSYRVTPPDRKVTISVGVVVMDHEIMTDCEAMIRVADDALYTAKRRGKDQIVIGKHRGGHA